MSVVTDSCAKAIKSKSIGNNALKIAFCGKTADVRSKVVIGMPVEVAVQVPFVQDDPLVLVPTALHFE